MATLHTTGEYSTSNSTMKFAGKKQLLAYLRSEARRLRTNSRSMRKLPLTVHAISAHLHPSKLVTMASFELQKLGVQELVTLLNYHGVIKYNVEK
jgi:hypothetical protein